MKLRASVLVLILTTAVQARQKLDVFVDNNARVPLEILAPAEAFAARILASADVTLAWHSSVSSARKGLNRMIVLDLQGNASATPNKRILGYALVHEGVHASIFCDRIRQIAPENQQCYLLAHAIAHEIAHLLQGVQHHSATGVMKAHWDEGDIFEMRHLLVLTPEDIRMIQKVKQPSYLIASAVY